MELLENITGKYWRHHQRDPAQSYEEGGGMTLHAVCEIHTKDTTSNNVERIVFHIPNIIRIRWKII